MEEFQNTLPDLLAQKAELDKQIADAKATEKADAFNQILQTMEDYEITVEEISKKLSKGSKKSSGTRGTVAPKYQLDDKTWTGRGKQPKWVAEALATGLTLEDLLIQK